MKKIKLSPAFIGFLQALALVFYATLMGAFLLNANTLFGPMPNFFGPALFLILLSFSALYCAIVVGAYPIWVFWEKKDTKLAYKIVISNALWLLLSILFFMLMMVFLK